MSFLEIFLLGGMVVWAFMTVLWIVSLWLRNSSIVDIFWGIGFVLLTGVYYPLADGVEARKLLISVLVILWGMRLSIYIGWRNWGKGEDFRYAAWREQAGERWWWRSYLKVFLLQGLIMWILSIVMLAAHHGKSATHLIWLDVVGAWVWGVGFFFETVGDFQLARFRANPANRGKVLNSGLWRYTRHPNYFGDAVQWWGYYLIALAAGGWWTIFSPLLMTYLLMRVSGVAMLETTLRETKPEYREYIERTNAFFPGIPRK